MQAEGVTPGVSDLFLMFPSNGWHGMFIEMKYGKGKLSEAQMEFLDLADSSSYATTVCYSLDDFMKAVEGYMKTNENRQ